MSDWFTETCWNSAEKRAREGGGGERPEGPPEHNIRFGTNGAWELVFV